MRRRLRDGNGLRPGEFLSESGRIAQPEINLGVFPEAEEFSDCPKLASWCFQSHGDDVLENSLMQRTVCVSDWSTDWLRPSATVSAALDLAERIAHKPFEAIKLIKEGGTGNRHGILR